MHGGIPATIGVLNGVARVGFEPEELIELTASAGSPSTLKISRRDLGYVCGLVLLQYFFQSSQNHCVHRLIEERAIQVEK